MSIAPGITLGPFHIESLLGEGGMGKVYRARDTRLDRLVAIKVLSDRIARDPHRQPRFEREARMIAALNHPHVCALYDLRHQDDITLLVMEYLEGETLAHRLKSGALPVEQALRIAAEIADGLDCAHCLGIVHRDLKPGNVMLTRNGAKLLDFGLAKLADAGRTGVGDSRETNTRSELLTAQDVVPGTLAYMSPEQLEGREADFRSDVFAFGSLLYEMLTGQRAFEGLSRASLAGAILRDTPRPLERVRPDAPRGLDWILSRCLAKDPEDRWQSARDLHAELSRVSSELQSPPDLRAAPLSTSTERPSRRMRVAVVGVVGFLLVAAVTAWMVARPSGAPSGRLTTFSLSGDVALRRDLALSPDGMALAYVTGTSANRVTWLRRLGGSAPEPLPGAEDAWHPFWSPDGRFLAFFSSDGILRRADIAGGPPVAVCGTGDPLFGSGGDWHDDTILFGASDGPIQRVSAEGGEPQPVTELDGMLGHLWPEFLPDGNHFLFVARSPAIGQHAVYAGSLSGGETVRLIETETQARYVPPGYLLFVRRGTLMAQRFDPTELVLIDEPFVVADRVGIERLRHLAAFAASDAGDIIYSEVAELSELVWFDRSGNVLSVVGEADEFENPALSPDETALAVEIVHPRSATSDLWVYDLDTQRPRRRFTFDPADDANPVWSPDGSRIAFASARSGQILYYAKDAVGGRQIEALLPSIASEVPSEIYMAWSAWWPQGNAVVHTRSSEGDLDLWLSPLDGDEPPRELIRTDGADGFPAVSPNGRWLAYSSSETGAFEVNVTSMPDAREVWVVSPSGGVQPQWRADGAELFYLEFLTGGSTRLMSAQIDPDARSFEYAPPVFLFEPDVNVVGARNSYVATGDGQRFLVSRRARSASGGVHWVTNWTSGLER